jgi:ubiquinone/menaquinone biosynthesis C-methylase UbiE
VSNGSGSPRGIKRSVQDQFDQAAANYRTSAVHARGEDLVKMVELARPAGHESVLDAGCGAGHTAIAFAPHVEHVVAVDFSEAMLAQVRELAAERGVSNLKTRLADVEHLPFAPATFDLVVSRYSAHHWPHPQQAIGEFARVLKPGAGLIISDTVGLEQPAQDTFLNAVELLRDVSHVRDHTPTQWLAMLDRAGFQGEIAFRWDVWLEFEPWVRRIGAPPPAVEALRWLFDHAPAESRQALKIQEDHRFALPGAIIRGTKR